MSGWAPHWAKHTASPAPHLSLPVGHGLDDLPCVLVRDLAADLLDGLQAPARLLPEHHAGWGHRQLKPFSPHVLWEWGKGETVKCGLTGLQPRRDILSSSEHRALTRTRTDEQAQLQLPASLHLERLAAAPRHWQHPVCESIGW